MEAMPDLIMDDLDMGSNIDQRVTQLEINVQQSIEVKCYSFVAVKNK